MTDQNEDVVNPADETGEAFPSFKIVSCRFGSYIIKIRLTPTNEFVDIVEVSFDSDFRSIRQRNQIGGFHNVSDLYEEREEK